MWWIEYVVYLSCVYRYILGWLFMSSYLLFCCTSIYFDVWCITCYPKQETLEVYTVIAYNICLDRTSLQVHSRSSSSYDWSTRSELYPETETAKGQPGCTYTGIAHTLGNGDETQQPARDYEGELAAAAAAATAAAVLLLCCCCFTTLDASRSTCS